jgi:hypothetical protein
LRQPVEPLREDVAVEDHRVTALGELHGSGGDCPAEYVVLVCRLGQPPLHRAVHNERREVIGPDVRASVEGGGDQPAHRRLARAGRSGDDEDRRRHAVDATELATTRAAHRTHLEQSVRRRRADGLPT